MRELSTLDKARLLIKAATGEEYDGWIVTDLVQGYAEPGYGNYSNGSFQDPDKAVVVFGNWNTRRSSYRADPPLTKEELLPHRLAEALEKVGAEIEWLDEWASCEDCHKALRIQPDSYRWKLYGAFVEAGYVCADCMQNDPEPYLQEYLNDPKRVISWLDANKLIELGFEKWNGTYESGWDEGQNDYPELITQEIRAEYEDVDIVFYFDENSQFYIRFSAWYREKDESSQEGQSEA